MADVPLLRNISERGGQLPISCSPFRETPKLIHSQLLWQAKVCKSAGNSLTPTVFGRLACLHFFLLKFFFGLLSVFFGWFDSDPSFLESLQVPQRDHLFGLPNNLSPAPRDWWCSYKDGHIVIMSWDFGQYTYLPARTSYIGCIPWPTLESEYGSPTKNVTL